MIKPNFVVPCAYANDTEIVFKVRDKEYVASFKMAFQTFGKSTELTVYRQGIWIPAKLSTIKEEHPMVKITTSGGRTVTMRKDHSIITPNGHVMVSNIEKHTNIMVNTKYDKRITTSGAISDKILSVEDVEYNEGWLFTVLMDCEQKQHFTITNGLILVS